MLYCKKRNDMQNSIYDNRVELRLTGSGTTNAYATFTVSMMRQYSALTPASYATIYTGKTWIDGNGDTTVYLGEILKEFDFVVDETYNATEQRYRPVSGAVLIEISGDNTRFFNTTVKVSFAGGEYVDTTTNLVSLRTAVPAMSDLATSTPFSGLQFFHSFNGAFNGILPRVPAINTINCYVSGLFTTRPGNNVLLMTEGVNNATLMNSRAGNVFACYSLAELYTALPDISAIADTDIQCYNSGDSAVKKTFAVVETCTKPYYLQWWDCNNIFHSWGMVRNGAVTTDGGNAFTYTDINVGKSVLECNPAHSWTLNTGNISKAEYYDLMTAYTARLMYLYDAELDMRYKVLPSVKSGQWTERSRGRQHNFNITLNEVII